MIQPFELLTLTIHNGYDGVGTVINILIYNIEVAGGYCLLQSLT